MKYKVSERFGSCLEHGCAHTDEHSQWSRRDFLSTLGRTAGSAVVLGSTAVHALAHSSILNTLSQNDSERILVLLQLNGGNDGLNTIIPVEDDRYFRARPTLAIPKRVALPLTSELGFHPAMAALRRLYDEGQMSIVQGVGYEDSSLSHFQGTDNWMSAVGGRSLDASGWIGRKLEFQFPDFEATPSEYPLAVQVGGIPSRLFDGQVQSMGMTMANVEVFRRLVRTGGLFDEQNIPDTAYGDEIKFMRRTANNAFIYGKAVQEAASRGTNSVSYPALEPYYFSERLSTVAQLIKGGLRTRVYHVSIGGFDTHGSQGGVIGRHATLLRAMSETVDAFLRDLGELRQDVLVMTFSEFGRRVYENGSDGTDHGTSAPLFLFGPGAKGGLFGQSPSLEHLDENGNLKHGIDFRAVYATVLQHWFGFGESASSRVLGQSFDLLDVIASPADPVHTSTQHADEIPGTLVLHQNYPNPFNPATVIEYELNESSSITLRVFDVAGRLVRTLVDQHLPAGRHTVRFHANGLPGGTYLYQLRTGHQVTSRRMVLLR